MQKNNLIQRGLLFLILSLIMVNATAQSGLNFQGVARTSNNVILASQSITVKFSILQGSTTGTAEYVETRRVNTNAQGLFTAVIGDTGTISKTGNYSTINWKSTPKFLKIEMDPAAGTNFVTMGTTQFQYVAYAQFAKSVDADNIVGIVPVTLGGTGVNSLTGLKTALAVDKVNNTADTDKPISASTQTALNLKLNTTDSIKFLKIADTIKYVKKAFVDSALITKVSSTGNVATATTATTATSAGTASSATKLTTARNINGISFDGSADITITANAGTLTGTTLKSSITESSLTSVGTLTSATVSGKVIVGTASATASSAVFEANSTTQGLLPPRMTYEQKTSITSPVAGLTIWCSNCGTSGQMQVYNGTVWTNMVGDVALGAVPTITTTAATSIASTSAVSGGTVTSDGGTTITARGVCWSTSINPTIANSKTIVAGTTGTYTSNITGLTINTTYYLRAYATNSVGTAYGNQISFSTVSLPTIASTLAATDITTTTAISGGNITSDGGGAITARGICWGTSVNPTTSNSLSTVAGTTGTYTSTMTSLTSGTLYYVRAYATNGAGTSYGTQISFNTQSPPIVASTTAATSITATSASSGGNLTNDGGLTITAKGVCWSTSPNPTIADSKTDNGVTAGTYISSITGLTASTLYYVRAYATNTAGTAYASQISFTTLATPPADVTSATGRIWLDRNLGASRVATSATDANAFGDLYQWGRATDGHQSRTSTKTNGIVTTNTPGDALFIFSSPSFLYDWRSPQNGDLWQGVTGVNNPCPTGYRLPTDVEWTAEIASWSSANADGAYASPLKLPRNGRFRDYASGDIPATVIGDPGYYWSSTVTGPDGLFTGNNAKYMRINSSVAQISIFPRASGLSVRCIKN